MTDFDFGRANERQKEAIRTVDGPLLITAGPGTGKTYTLVLRALYILTHKTGVKPENILITTFTDKAANEIIGRLTDEARIRDIELNVGEMYIGTFHSICGRILKDYLEFTDAGLRRNYRVIDEFERNYRVFKAIDEFKNIPGAGKVIKRWDENSRSHKTYENADDMKKTESDWNDAGKVCDLVSKFEEELVTAEELKADTEDEGIAAMGRIMEYYRKFLGNDMTDYAGLQVECYRLLCENSEILKMVREKIRYLMIDEYQDTNYIQEQLVLLIGGEHKNICVVGDDDQSLYRFRNATVNNILEFHKLDLFKGMEREPIKLETNHRSNKKIIDFYNKWMATTESNEEGKGFSFSWEKKDSLGNTIRFRHDKTIVPDLKSDKNNDFEAVVRLDGADDKEWRERILEFIMRLKDSKKMDYNQFVFLFFSVKDDRVMKLAEFLESKKVQVYSPRSEMFFKREEVMLTIGCLLHLFPKYRKYMACPAKGKRNEFHEYYISCINLLNGPEYGGLREELKGINPADYGYAELLYRLFGLSYFRGHLDVDIKTSSVLDTRPARNLGIITGIVARYESLNDIRKTNDKATEGLLDEYLKLQYANGVNEYEDDVEYAPKGCVSFMTIHQAKGMEFPVVFVGLLDRFAADSKKEPKPPKKEKEVELEYRIANKYYRRKEFEPPKMKKYFDFWRRYYTAFSRARNLLVLTCPKGEGEGEKPVPIDYFLPVYKDLGTEPDERIEYEPAKNADLKEKFSFTSHIAVYDSCPRQYKFNKVLGFRSARHGSMAHAEFGTLVHETIEDVNRAAIRGEEFLITEERIADWLNANYNAMVQSDENVDIPPEKRAEALQHVLRYAAQLEGKWATVQEAEVSVILDAKDYIIEGKIDLMKSEGDTVEIVDFKTSEEKPKPGDYHYNRYKKQLELYAILLKEQRGYKVSRMHLYYTSEEKDPLITFEYTDADVQKTRDAFDRTARKIMARDFSGPPSTRKLCDKCDFRFYCGNRFIK